MSDNTNVESRIKDLETVREVLESHGVRFFVVYGAVLGFHRDGNFIEHDDDIDLAIVDPIDLKTRKAIGWALYDLGFRPQNITFNVFGRMEPSEIGYNGDAETGIIVCERNFKFTIFFFKEEDCAQHGKEMVCTPKLGSVKLISTPSKFFGNPETIKINKKKYLVPGPVEDYLNWAYFDNWQDRNDRRHSDTYFVQHASAMVNLDGKNEVTIYG